MDQQVEMFQNLIDSIRSLSNEVNQLRSKVFTLEKENQELKDKLLGDSLMSKLAPIPLEDSRDEYLEDPKYEFEVSEFEQIPYEEQKEIDNYRKEVEHQWKMKDYLKCIPPMKVLFDEFKNEKQSEETEEEEKVEQNFIQWLKEPNNDQVLTIMQHLYSHPYEWEINFESLSEATKAKLFFPLKEFFLDQLSDLPAERCYNIEFGVNGSWHTVYLEDVYENLTKDMRLENMIYHLEMPEQEDFVSGGKITAIPKLSLIDQMHFYKTREVRANNDIGAHFFRFLIPEKTPQVLKDYLKRLQIFDTLVNDKGKQRKELDECCFIYALQQAKFPNINQIKARINSRYISQSMVNDLCKEFNIHLTLRYFDNERSRQVRQTTSEGKVNYLGNKQGSFKVELNIFEHHYFIQEKTPFTSNYIEDFWNLSEDYAGKRRYMKNGKECWQKTDRRITSMELLKQLFNQEFFIPITVSQFQVLKTVYTREIDQNVFESLDFNPEFCTKLIQPPKEVPNQTEISYYYADFESVVRDVPYHKPFLVCYQCVSGVGSWAFFGEDCAEKFLDQLPDNSVVFFHNLAYDARMFARYGLKSSIQRGSQMICCSMEYKGKKIKFHDTLQILRCKISDLPRRFHLEEMQKELFPYNYYTFDLLKDNKGVIDEAGKYDNWTEEDYIQFKKNIDSIKGCRIDKSHFDMRKYALFYCMQDVSILRKGFNAFRKGWMKDFKFDPFKALTISSLAYQLFNARVFYPNRNLYSVGGVIRLFLSRAIHGGRCMCAFNKKWDVIGPIVDFDAVSLYPSAMRRLCTVEGIPHVIPEEHLNMEFLSQQSAYVVDVEITKVNKHYPFPLILQKTPQGNLNDDHIDEPIIMTVDNIELEDLINFQKIEFKILRGYFWNGKKDYTIQKVIQQIFDKRLEYKKEKNPIQELYKALMNSSYGKSIEKAHDTKTVYIKGKEKMEKYRQKNYNKIIETIQLRDSEIYSIKVLKQIDKHFNNSLYGIQVLSMSKRIMNEVMCLAYDEGCKIFYQDTDSMHIMKDDLPFLEVAFKEKYGRDLIGSNLGQFHSDFCSDDGRDDVEYSLHSIFLMKKMYYDELLLSDGTIAHMSRGKGLTEASIYKASNGDLLNLYRRMFKGEEVSFDLLAGGVKMVMNQDMTVETRKKFIRKTKTNYPVGKIDEYFDY